MELWVLKSKQVLICEGIEAMPMYNFSMDVHILLVCVPTLPGAYILVSKGLVGAYL